jgi:hypothetical protein
VALREIHVCAMKGMQASMLSLNNSGGGLRNGECRWGRNVSNGWHASIIAQSEQRWWWSEQW